MSSSSKIFLALIAGAAIGATLGILLAPDKGSETMKSLNDLKDSFLDNLKEKAEKSLDAISDATESIAGKITNRVDLAEELVKSGTDSLKSKVK